MSYRSKNIFEKCNSPSLVMFVVGLILVGVGSVSLVAHLPFGFLILVFGGLLAVIFAAISVVTLLFHISGVKLRKRHVFINTAGLFLIFLAMILYVEPLTLVMLFMGLVLFIAGCFPWACKLPAYVPLAIGAIFFTFAYLAWLYIPLVVVHKYEGDETPEFLTHLIICTLGMFGIVFILSGIASFFKWLLTKTNIQLIKQQEITNSLDSGKE